MIRENCPFQNTNVKNRNPQPKWTHRVFFPHVPKCAGTSVNLMIRESFPQMHSQSIDLHRSKLAAGSIGLDIMTQRKALVAYWMAYDQPSLISGHCQSTYSSPVLPY